MYAPHNLDSSCASDTLSPFGNQLQVQNGDVSLAPLDIRQETAVNPHPLGQSGLILANALYLVGAPGESELVCRIRNRDGHRALRKQITLESPRVSQIFVTHLPTSKSEYNFGQVRRSEWSEGPPTRSRLVS